MLICQHIAFYMDSFSMSLKIRYGGCIGIFVLCLSMRDLAWPLICCRMAWMRERSPLVYDIYSFDFFFSLLCVHQLAPK